MKEAPVNDVSSAAERSPYWGVPLARAVPYVITGLVITFTSDHSPLMGLISYGILAVVSGVIVGVLTLRTLTAPRDRSARLFFLIQSVVSVILGALSLAFSAAGHGAALEAFVFVVGMNSAIGGFLELYTGLRSKNPAARDWTIVGAGTVILAIVTLLLPPGDPVLAIGILGAYAIIAGLFLVIAGFSLRWGGHQISTSRTRKTT
jgi:uncharacterized membrane protein HdeD (DUF308 family)